MSVLHPQLDIAESNLLCARLLLEASEAEPESSTQTGKPRSLIGSDFLAKQVGADLVAAQLLDQIRFFGSRRKKRGLVFWRSELELERARISQASSYFG